MSKYGPLWEHVKGEGKAELVMSFSGIERLPGFPIDHSFLNFKKELTAYGYEVKRISMKNENVCFIRKDEEK